MNAISRLAISDEGFIFDPQKGNSFTTNRAGLFILGLLKAGAGEKEIVPRLVDRYRISRAQAEQDFLEFKEQLVSHQLLGENHD